MDETERWREDARRYAANAEYWKQRAEAAEQRLADPMIWCACGDGFPTIEQMHHHIHMVHEGFELDPGSDRT